MFPVFLAIATAVTGAGAGSAGSDAEAYAAYMAEIEELSESGLIIAEEQGKQGLIDRYRDIMRRYPDFPNNRELEAEIAGVYELDLKFRGEPPDFAQALDIYTRLASQCEQDDPLRKEAVLRAARCAEVVDPPAAAQMYTGLCEEYPADTELQLRCYVSMGRLASGRGDAITALQYFQGVIDFDATTLSQSQPGYSKALAWQQTAAMGVISEIIRNAASPSEQLKAFEKLLEDYPAIARKFPDLAARFRGSLERRVEKAAAGETPESVETLLTALAENPATGPGQSTVGLSASAKRTGRVFGARSPDTVGEAVEPVPPIQAAPPARQETARTAIRGHALIGVAVILILALVFMMALGRSMLSR